MSTDTILIVNDEEDIRNLVALVLRDKGFSVRTASSGQEALACIGKLKPSLVILDLLMPQMSGEDFCKIIKTDPVLNDIIIIILSAKDDLQSKLNCLNIGAEEYLVKPVDIEELAARVSRFLSLMNRWKNRVPVARPDPNEKTQPTIHISDTHPDSSAPSETQPEKPKEKQRSSYGVYHIETLAGTGGMGLVYKAQDETLDRYVAVKVLSKEWSSSPEFLERFQREAKVIAAINHPGIAQIYTFGEEEGESYFALQWCSGGSLANLIRRQGKIDLLTAIDIVLQCVRGLEAASQKGVVHRDIKPSNLMFDENQQIKIVDFGVASSERIPEKGGKSQQVIGSPAYMAPEQGRGGSTDHRADIYSLGITFYHMLYGHHPFSAKSPREWIAKHAEQPFPDYDSLGGKIPPAAYQLIKKMTEKDPAARYERYQELIKHLENLRSELYSQRRLKIAKAFEVAATPRFTNNNFFDLLGDIFRQHSSGLLKASWGRLQKKFLIARNQLVHFESPQTDENYWTVLVNRELMKKEDVPQRDEDLEESLNRLLFLQAFSLEDFKTVYRETMIESFLQVFRWPVIEAQFFKATIEHEGFAPVSLAKLLMEAARNVIPSDSISSSVPRDKVIMRTDRFEEILGTLDLPRAEGFLASRVEGQNVTLEILQLLTGLPVELVMRTVYAMESLGALSYHSAAQRQARRSEHSPAEITPAKPVQPVVEAISHHKSRSRRKEWLETPSIRDPEEARKQHNLAEAKYRSGEYWEVSRHCLVAIKNNPNEAKYHHLMALALTRFPHSVKVAEEAYRQAIRLEPGNFQYRLDFVTFLKDRGRFDAAFEECEKILVISPTQRTARRLLAEIELER